MFYCKTESDSLDGWLSLLGFRGPKFDSDPGPILNKRGTYESRKIREIRRGVGTGASNRI